MRLVGLAGRLQQHPGARREGDADVVRPRRHRHADDQVIVDIVLRRLVVQRHVVHQLRRRDGERLDPFPVDQKLQIVRLAQALDVLVAVARQPDRELVDPVGREVPGREQAAARTDRQTLDMLLLSQIGIRAEGDAGRFGHPAHGETADLLRRADVALEQGRREVPDRHVVESVARGVRRQQRGDVDLQRQQVADRVVVLRAVQPAEGLRAARVGLFRSDAVQLAFERRQRLPVRTLVRTATARRRHLPRPQLAGHFLPRRAVEARVLLHQCVQLEPRRLEPVVVATQAVARDEDAVRRVGVERRSGHRRRRRGPGSCSRSSRRKKRPETHDSHANRLRATTATASWEAHLQLPG